MENEYKNVKALEMSKPDEGNIWQIVSLLKNSQDLPPSVEEEWAAKNKTEK